MKKDFHDDIEIIQYVEKVEDILSRVRLLEHEMFIICSVHDVIEDDLIQIKLRLKSLKMDLYAVDDIK